MECGGFLSENGRFGRGNDNVGVFLRDVNVRRATAPASVGWYSGFTSRRLRRRTSSSCATARSLESRSPCSSGRSCTMSSFQGRARVRKIRASAQRVNLARDQLLARAGLTRDEYRRVTRRNAFDSRQQCSRQRILEHQGLGPDRKRSRGGIGKRQHGRRYSILMAQTLLWWNAGDFCQKTADSVGVMTMLAFFCET